MFPYADFENKYCCKNEATCASAIRASGKYFGI
jgi:hypothetical protein